MIFPPPETVIDKGHGRIEKRTIRTTTALNDYINFPYLEQVARVERVRMDLEGNIMSQETVCLVTSLTEEEAGPLRLLELSREHWHIENRLHWVRDVTFDEDRAQIRTGSGPRVFATLRNLVISIMRLTGITNIAEGLRSFAWGPKEDALAVFGI